MSELGSAHRIENPTPDQVHWALEEAGFLGEVAEQGGMTAEEAIQRRRQVLARIGMGNYVEQ